MKATFDGATVLDIEYSAKEIKPHFCRATREMEFDCYLDGRYVGTANSHGEAAAKLDALVFDALTHGDTATAKELDGGSYCATCGNEGDCPDCEPAVADATTRQHMMQLAATVNELRLTVKVARGWRRASLNDKLTAAELELRAAQRAYLAEQRAVAA